MARNQLYSGARRPAADFRATLGQAITAHQAGNLTQAEALYNVVLSKDDRHFDALHMLGVLAGQRV